MELKDTIDKLGQAFDAFKKSNDERLATLEKGKGTAEIEEKLSTMNAEMDKLSGLKSEIERVEKLANRPDSAKDFDPAKAEHKEAFKKFMRKGADDGLQDLQKKAYNITTDADGGYAVPEEIDREILSQLVDISPMRELATVRQIGTSDYKKLVNVHGTASGWVDEDDARTATNTSQLQSVTPFMGELYANPQATQQMLEDVFFDAEQWLAEEVAQEFARNEGAAFITGDGTKKPKGILAYTTAATADSSRAFGTLQHVATGVAGAWGASNPQDILITLVHSLKRGYRKNANFILNKALLGDVRKFKDVDGQYIWRPGLEAGQADTLLGYGIAEDEEMPAVAANSLSIAFGDFKRGYLIVDRIGTQVLRDPYSNKPYVGFYTRKRVGGAVVDSQAIKLLKFAAA